MTSTINEDVVNKPKHYIPENPAYEVVKVAEAHGIDKDAYLFNVLKYICRAGKKDPNKVIQDLEKAQFFLNRKIDNLKIAKAASEEKLKEQVDASMKEVFNILLGEFKDYRPTSVTGGPHGYGMETR
jgi:hypothetical protein